MIYFLVPEEGAFGMREYLESWGRKVAERVRLLPYEELFERDALESGTYVFSGLDQLSPTALEWTENVCREMERTAGMRSVNRPGATLKRYDLLRALHDSGRNRFRACRATEERVSLRFPVFLREENGHTGSLTDLLYDPHALDRARGDLLCKGYNLDELLMVEFCDTRDQSGWFRRYAAFVVGKEVLPRSLAFSRHWVAKARTRVMEEKMIAEERDYVCRNPHASELREIAELCRVEYGRIDYGVLDGRVQTWEINLNPTIGRSPSSRRRRHLPQEVEQKRLLAKERFFERFGEALLSLEAESGGGGPSLRLAASGVLRAKLRAEERRRLRRRKWRTAVQEARTLLFPFERLLRPALAASSPFIARLRLWLD